MIQKIKMAPFDYYLILCYDLASNYMSLVQFYLGDILLILRTLLRIAQKNLFDLFDMTTNSKCFVTCTLCACRVLVSVGAVGALYSD